MSQQTVYHLKQENYISIATTDWRRNPHVSTKILFRIEPSLIYIVDNAVGKTCNNIKRNHRVALTIINKEEQLSYRIYGIAKLLTQGKEYQDLIEYFNSKKIEYTTSRVIEGVRRGRKHKSFDLFSAPPKAIIKVKVKKVVKMNLFGNKEENNL